MTIGELKKKKRERERAHERGSWDIISTAYLSFFAPASKPEMFRPIFYPSSVTIKVYYVGPALRSAALRGCAWLFFTRGNKRTTRRKSGRGGSKGNVRRRRVNRCERGNKSIGRVLSLFIFVTPLRLCCRRAVPTVNQSRSGIFAFHRFLRHRGKSRAAAP